VLRYHAKIAKSHELGLNMHWIIRLADHVAKQRIVATAAKRGAGHASSSSSSSTGGARGKAGGHALASSHDGDDRGRARTRGSGGGGGGGGLRSASGDVRDRSASVGTRFSMGSNDDGDKHSEVDVELHRY